jgi:hydrogenase maturation factor HypF (carbamoyltransferase family)
MIAATASLAELGEHFRVLRNERAQRRYDDAIHMCLGCGREGENTVDKRYGVARFCSPECAAIEQRYLALVKGGAA